MKTTFKLLILALSAVFLEFLFHSYTWTPSFLFMVVLFIALQWRDQVGAASGFIVGTFYAGLFAEPPGLSALSLSLVGYVAGKTAPFLMDTPGIVIFLFAFIFFLVNDFFGSAVMSFFYSPFWEIRIGDAILGGLVFSLSYNPLLRFFSNKRI